MPEIAGYTKTQSFTDGKTVVGSASTSSQVSVDTEFSAIATWSGSLNAITTSGELTLQGDLNFNTNDVTNVKSINSTIWHIDGFGAAGDGSTDDRAAFISAINEIAAAGGGILLLGPNTYRIASEISGGNLTTGFDNVVFMGVPGTTILKDTSSANNLFELDSDAGAQFHNIRFYTGTDETGGYFLDELATGTVIANCRFQSQDTDQDGAFRFTTSTTHERVFIRDVAIDGSYDGNVVVLRGIRGGSVNGVYMSITGGTPTYGIQITDTNDNEQATFSNLSVKMASGAASGACLAIDSTGTGQLQVSNVSLTTAVDGHDGIQLVPSAQRVHVSGGNIFLNTNDSSSAGVAMTSTTYCSITGVDIRGNGASCAGTAVDADNAVGARITGGIWDDFASGVGLKYDSASGFGLGMILDDVGTAASGTPSNFQFTNGATSDANHDLDA